MSREAYERNLRRWAMRRAAMAALRAKGWTFQAIAKRYRISRQSVHQALNK
jgi:lambda repressor-like predicted transcriptional regulator